jgi:hypothetical protein
MKKILTRFSILLLLSGAVVLISNTNDTKAFDCVSLNDMWDDMGECDSNFWTGTSPYHDVVYNNPNHCHTVAENACAHLLGQPGYAACYSAAYNSCIDQAETNYYNAIDNYGSCLTAAVNPDCFEVLEFCPGARDRAAACETLANEECCVYSDCLNASGVWQCQ